MQMHANLGVYMRQRYVGAGRLVPAYNYTQTVVRSTDVDRTLQSALSQLLTWFPASPAVFASIAPAWQPVPVHTVPVNLDSILRPFDDGSCPRFMQLKATHPARQAWLDKLAEICPPDACTVRGLPHKYAAHHGPVDSTGLLATPNRQWAWRRGARTTPTLPS